MNISALLANPEPELKQGLKRKHSSVSISSSKPRRRRHDPKPIWAILEHEPLPKDYESPIRKQPIRPPPPPPPAPSPRANKSRTPSVPPPSSALNLLEIPITCAPVYEELSRHVCDFIWKTVFNNPEVLAVVEQCPGAEVEVEARWGQVVYAQNGQRIREPHSTECVLRNQIAKRFESTMSVEQHKRVNQLLNKQVQMAQPNQQAGRPTIVYKHTKEVDTFYELDQERFLALPDPIKALLERTLNPKKGVRVRVTRDLKDGRIVRQIIKHKLENLDISSPQTEWDYRVGVNLEIDYPGSVEGLNMVVEKDTHGDPLPSDRKKDRISYSWLNAYQIDLTQVVQGNVKNHELEIELSAARLFEAKEALERTGTSDFEPLVRGMLNNLRELSRHMTRPPGA